SFIRFSHLEAKVVENLECFTQAEILARAGLKGAMTLLAMDDKERDDLTEAWADFNRYAALASGLLGEGAFTGRIEDLSARFNPNFLVDAKGLIDKDRQAQFGRLLTLVQLDPQAIPAVLDWLDPDEETRPGGAESSAYLAGADPYTPANGPFLALSQLALVKGFTAEALYGTTDRPGLLEYLTVHSEGRINLNTAGEVVLMSLDDGLTKSVAQDIMKTRSTKPFEKLDDLKEVPGLTPEVLARLAGRVSVASSYFLVYVEGAYREARAAITAIVHRAGGGVRLIYFRAG
ncbi:MAG: type II secretion system minor pseudopilin GspK, partial [Thermodesulfobacteriota bacterium]